MALFFVKINVHEKGVHEGNQLTPVEAAPAVNLAEGSFVPNSLDHSQDGAAFVDDFEIQNLLEEDLSAGLALEQTFTDVDWKTSRSLRRDCGPSDPSNAKSNRLCAAHAF